MQSSVERRIINKPMHLFVIIAILWSTLLLLQKLVFFKSKNISISFGYLRVTADFKKQWLPQNYFFFAFILTFSAIIGSVLLLVSSIWIFWNLWPSNISSSAITVAIPGITIPISHFGHMFSVVLINAVFHEYGHALAAHLNNVEILDCGLVLFFVLPGAFVSFDLKQIQRTSAWKVLQIYSAGIFNNLLLAAMFSIIAFGFMNVKHLWTLQSDHPIILDNLNVESVIHFLIFSCLILPLDPKFYL